MKARPLRRSGCVPRSGPSPVRPMTIRATKTSTEIAIPTGSDHRLIAHRPARTRPVTCEIQARSRRACPVRISPTYSSRASTFCFAPAPTRPPRPSLSTRSGSRRGWGCSSATARRRYGLERDTNFTWAILIHPKTPNWVRAALRQAASEGAQIETPLGRVRKAIRGLIRERGVDSPYLITSRLDNDDALLTSSPYGAGPRGVRRSRVECLDIPWGYTYDPRTKLVLARANHQNPFISLVEKAATVSPQTVFSTDSPRIDQVAPIRPSFDDAPGWLQVIHGGNIRNRMEAMHSVATSPSSSGQDSLSRRKRTDPGPGLELLPGRVSRRDQHWAGDSGEGPRCPASSRSSRLARRLGFVVEARVDARVAEANPAGPVVGATPEELVDAGEGGGGVAGEVLVADGEAPAGIGRARSQRTSRRTAPRSRTPFSKSAVHLRHLVVGDRSRPGPRASPGSPPSSAPPRGRHGRGGRTRRRGTSPRASSTISVLSGVGSTHRLPPLRLEYSAFMPRPRNPRNSARSTRSARSQLGFVRSW